MNQIKKITTLMFVLLVVLTLAGCGSKNQITNDSPVKKVDRNQQKADANPVVVDGDEQDIDENDANNGIVSIDITGFNFGYSIETIEVKQGDTVTINFESTDGFHDWVVDEFNAATEKVNPGTPTSVTFVADKAGEYEFYCSVGQHRANGMVGKLIVLPADSAEANNQEEQGEDDSSVGSGKSMNSNDIVEKLANSPRHQERVKVLNNGKTIYNWVVYPEVDEPAPVVLVIHENKGLTDWVRQMADDIAAQGYIAIAPDLLSSFSEEQQGTYDFESEDAATKALYTLTPEQVMSDLQAVSTYATSLQASNGKLASVGFCWGGSQSFRYASVNPDLDKSFVFYGTAPEEEDVYANIDVPVIAFYGGDDARVNATIEKTAQLMIDNNNDFNYMVYEGAGHAFMRSAVGENPEQANVDARQGAFTEMLKELEELK